MVSFDVFDTLLIRLVPSEWTTRLAVEKFIGFLEKEASGRLTFQEIYGNRCAFKFANTPRTFVFERQWTLSQWLEQVSGRYNIPLDTVLECGFRAEIEAESVCLIVADEVSDTLRLVKQAGLIVVATSDMWLDRDLLRDLLKRFGLHFDAVFSSGSEGVSKRRGTLFRKVRQQFGLPAGALLHVGDHWKNDVLMPRLMGSKAAWIAGADDRKFGMLDGLLPKGRWAKQPCQTIVRALATKSASKAKAADSYYRLAYDYLAPLLILFALSQWRKFRAQRIEHVFYIARDAWLPFEVYGLLEDYLGNDFSRYYVRLSRSAVTLAHPDNLLQNAIPLAGKLGRKTVGDWLGNFRIEEGLLDTILARAGITARTPFSDSVRERIRDVCDGLLPEILRAQTEQSLLIRDYLMSVAGNGELKRVGLVDTGWACTTQDAVRGVFQDAEVVSGVYLGVSAQGHRPEERNLKYGLLRDDFRTKGYLNPMEATAGVVRIWDRLLQEPTASVNELRREADGSVSPVMDSNWQMDEVEVGTARLIQDGVRQGVLARRKGMAALIECCNFWSQSDLEMAAREFARKISTRPSRRTAEAILRLRHEEGAEKNRSSALGLAGVFDGLAWYPGVLSSSGLYWLSPLLEYTAGIVVRRRVMRNLTCAPRSSF